MGSPRFMPTHWRFACSIGSIALATLAFVQLHVSLQPADIAFLYLLVVLIDATAFGLSPALLASIAAFLALNFFFIPPLHTFTVATPQDVIRLATFLIVAVITSQLAGRAQEQAQRAERRAVELAALYNLSQAISAEVALERILPMITQMTAELLQVPSCAILLYDQHGRLVERANSGSIAADAKQVDTFLRVGPRVLGVLRVTQRSLQEPLTAAQRERLQTISTQVVLVLERARLAEEAGHAQALADSDRLKSALLASVSHDLRTPLAVIKGAVTNLLEDDVGWDAAAQRDFLSTINEETDRLNRLVGNLLEMSRIEAGTLQRTRNWQDLRELIGAVVMRLGSRLAQHPLRLDVADDLPLIEVNYTQIDQVLTNLLENAANYAPSGTPIAVRVRLEHQHVRIEVVDQGPGIPEGMETRIFEKFVRATSPERHAEGSGLGLAICKGLVEAHGGRIWASNQAEGGTRFSVILPRQVAIPRQPSRTDTVSSESQGHAP